MKVTKKNFKPNMIVVVNDKSFRFAYTEEKELEAYFVSDIKDLDIWHDRTPNVKIPTGAILETIAMVNHEGSYRCVFKVVGVDQLFQAFWNTFTKKTDIK